MRSEGDQKNKKIPYSPYVTHTHPCHPPPGVPMDQRILSFLHKRAEMKKMRDLLFYHEMKQKRISKIKSKSYRKVRVRYKTTVVLIFFSQP